MGKFTIEERKEKLNEYNLHKNEYYKGQICTFYFIGLCWLGKKCQYAHGIGDFNMETFLKFCEDKRKGVTSEKHYVRSVQKTYLIIPGERNYHILHSYQELNKDKFVTNYTLDQLNLDMRKRVAIRNAMNQEIYEAFVVKLLTEFESMSNSQFEFYIESFGINHKDKSMLVF